jgi:AcrR family transcriptional regulator
VSIAEAARGVEKRGVEKRGVEERGVETPSRHLRADAQRNYDKIVEVAAQAFAENGTQTSLDDIACKAGVGPGTLYRHFPSRDCLLVAALRERREGLRELAMRLGDSADAGSAFDEWLFELASHLRTYGGLPDSVAQSFQEADSPLKTSCEPLMYETATLLERAQTSGAIAESVEPRDVFSIVASLAWAADRGGDSDDVLRRRLGLFMAGLR